MVDKDIAVRLQGLVAAMAGWEMESAFADFHLDLVEGCAAVCHPCRPTSPLLTYATKISRKRCTVLMPGFSHGLAYHALLTSHHELLRSCSRFAQVGPVGPEFLIATWRIYAAFCASGNQIPLRFFC